jgi:hypothetical protein
MLMKKAQGLPINFIVLAAVGIFVLILAIMFVLGGGTSASTAISPQQARATCNSQCAGIQSWALGQPIKVAFNGNFVDNNAAGTPDAPTDFCKGRNVAGISGTVGCDAAALGATCVVSFQDGLSCNVGCVSTGGNPKCLS